MNIQNPPPEQIIGRAPFGYVENFNENEWINLSQSHWEERQQLLQTVDPKVASSYSKRIAFEQKEKEIVPVIVNDYSNTPMRIDCTHDEGNLHNHLKRTPPW